MAGLSVDSLLNRQTSETTNLQDFIDAEDQIKEENLKKPLVVGSGDSGLRPKAPPSPITPTPLLPHENTTPIPNILTTPTKRRGGKSKIEKEESLSALPEENSLFQGREIKFVIVDSIPDLLIFTGDGQVLGYAVLVQDRWLVKAPDQAMERIMQFTSMASLTKGEQAKWPGKLNSTQNGSKPTK